MPRGKFDRNKVKPAGEYIMEQATSYRVESMITEADQELSETPCQFPLGQGAAGTGQACS